MSICIFSACDQQVQDKSNLNRQAYFLLKEKLSIDLNNLATELRKYEPEQKLNVSIGIAESYYGKGSKQFAAFSQSFDMLHSPVSGKVSNSFKVSAFQQNEIESLISESENFSNISEYKVFLTSKFDEYYSSNLNIEDKNFMLIFVSSFEVSLEFINSNPDLFQTVVSNGKIKGFWGCAAGIAGAVAVTTAVVGAVITPPLWVLAASEWYLVVSAGAASITTIAAECWDDYEENHTQYIFPNFYNYTVYNDWDEFNDIDYFAR